MVGAVDSRLSDLNLKIKIIVYNVWIGGHSSLSWFSYRSSFWVKLEFRMLVFVEGGKPEKLEKNARGMARTNSNFTITAKILARSLAYFYCQYADRHMNL